MTKYVPELGQACFGNAIGQHDMPDYAEALLLQLLEAIKIVYWNKYQERWDVRDNPEIPGIEFRGYQWSCDCRDGHDDSCDTQKPNFACDGVEIRWYKHPGRGMSTNQELTPDQWCFW